MRRFWLLVFILVSVNAVEAQQVKHAPTVAQCRADQRLWLSKLEHTGVADPVAHVSYKELFEWERELLECKSVDPSRTSQYYNTAAEIDAERADRLTFFLYRHGLMDQFYAEDAQGKPR